MYNSRTCWWIFAVCIVIFNRQIYGEDTGETTTIEPNPCEEFGCERGTQCDVDGDICKCLDPYFGPKCQEEKIDFCGKIVPGTKQVYYAFCLGRASSCEYNETRAYCTCNDNTMIFNEEAKECEDACLSKTCNTSQCISEDHQCKCIGLWTNDNCQTYNYCETTYEDKSEEPPKMISAQNICEDLNLECINEASDWTCLCNDTMVFIRNESSCVDVCESKGCNSASQCLSKDHKCECVGLWDGDDCQTLNYCKRVVEMDAADPSKKESVSAEEVCKRTDGKCISIMENKTYSCACNKDNKAYNDKELKCMDACEYYKSCTDVTQCEAKNHVCTCLDSWIGETCSEENFCLTETVEEKSATEFCESVNAACKLVASNLNWTCECNNDKEMFSMKENKCIDACNLNTTCVEKDACEGRNHTCQCKGIWFGDDCAEADLCLTVEDGLTVHEYCKKKNAVCLPSLTTRTCMCIEDTDAFDEDKKECKDACALKGCTNKAQCSSKNNRCQCKDLWEGDACDFQNFCNSKVEKGNAIEFCASINSNCSSNGEDWTCICSQKDTTFNKAKQICENPCAPNPCINGKCHVELYNYTCTCHDGYTGDLCQHRNWCEDAIIRKICEKGGAKCITDANYESYICECEENEYFNLLSGCTANPNCLDNTDCDEAERCKDFVCRSIQCRLNEEWDEALERCVCKTGFYMKNNVCVDYSCELYFIANCEFHQCKYGNCSEECILPLIGKNCDEIAAKDNCTTDLNCGINGKCVNEGCICHNGYDSENNTCIARKIGGMCEEIADGKCINSPTWRFNATAKQFERNYDYCKNGNEGFEECDKKGKECFLTESNFECHCLEGSKENAMGNCLKECSEPLKSECPMKSMVCKIENGNENCFCPLGSFHENNVGCQNAKSILKGSITIRSTPEGITRYKVSYAENEKCGDVSSVVKDLQESLKYTVSEVIDSRILDQKCVEQDVIVTLEVYYKKEVKQLIIPNCFNKTVDYCLIPPKSMAKKSSIDNVKNTFTQINMCDTNPCPANTDCKSKENNLYECECKQNYVSTKEYNNQGNVIRFCEDKRCENMNCGPNMECKIENDIPACDCIETFIRIYEENGQFTCQKPCNSNPCKNGGTCIPKDHDFECNCIYGYYGRFCINEDARLKKARVNVIIVGAVLGATLFLVIVITFITIKRLKNQKKSLAASYKRNEAPRPGNLSSMNHENFAYSDNESATKL